MLRLETVEPHTFSVLNQLMQMFETKNIRKCFFKFVQLIYFNT